MKTLVVGIGSTIRRDDGIGVRAARQFKERCSSPHVDVIELGTAGLSLLDFIDGYDRLIILDAIITGSPPGTVHELKGEDVTKTVHLGVGHEADLPTSLRLGKQLTGRMPSDVLVFAVEAGDIQTFSEQLSPEVQDAIPVVLARIERLTTANDSTPAKRAVAPIERAGFPKGSEEGS
jgi:hydrogenase maturation protease